MIRVDQALVDRGICESREKTKRAVMSGQILVSTVSPPANPTMLVPQPSDDPIIANRADKVAVSPRLVYANARKVRHV